MSKIRIFIIITLILAIAGFITYKSITDTHKVTLTPVESSFTLYKGDGKGEKVATISKAQTLDLREGQYCAQADDKKYSQDPVCFTVYKNDVEKEIDFNYSKDTLRDILNQEWSAIDSRIKSSYKKTISSYTICRGELLKKGEWYIGTIREKVVNASDPSDYYRIILNKDGNTWSIQNTPRVAISRHSEEVKDIPVEIIQQANSLKPCAQQTGLSKPLPDTTVYPKPPAIRDGF